MFTTKSTKSIIQLTFLVALFALFAGYTYLNAAWSNPAGAPPSNNVAAPLNVSSAAQDKPGVLGLSGLGVFGDASINSGLPLFKLQDTTAGAIDFWAAVENNAFYLFADRNSDNSWTEASPLTMITTTDTNGVGDLASFSDRVGAKQYCDQNGANCFAATDVSGGGGGGGTTGVLPMVYTGSQVVNTGIPSTAFCAVTGVDNGGCDSGARCKIGISGSTWRVDQRQGGDCNYGVTCEYACSTTDTISYTYSWKLVSATCSATQQECSIAYGVYQNSTFSCINQFNQTVANSNCTGPKPASDGLSCSVAQYGSMGQCR